MPNRRIYPDHPLSSRESNQRRREKCQRLKICFACSQTNGRHPLLLCATCADIRHSKDIAKRLQFKREIFNAYGGARCACCGETELCFLTLDHFTVNKNQFKERGGERSYRELRQLGYPSGFRVLCFNCNAGRWINGGTCPHAKGV